MIGGIISELNGGSFSQGAIISAASAAASMGLNEMTKNSQGIERQGTVGEGADRRAQADLEVSQAEKAINAIEPKPAKPVKTAAPATPAAPIESGATDPYHFYAGGTWIEDTCFNAQLGQSVKIDVKNVNILGTTISIEASSIGETQQSILLPQQRRVFQFAVFGAEPMSWKFCISTISDAFNVLYEIKSTWVPGMPENH